MTDVRRGLTAFGVLAALALGVLVLGSLRLLGPVEDAVGGAALPVQRALSPAADGVRGFFGGLTYGWRAREESERLRSQVETLTAENARLKQLQDANDKLREQLGFTAAKPALRFIPAQVIGRDPTSLRQHLLIDRGAADGVAVGLAVTSPGGIVVGQVSRVERRRSEVLLITDVESSLNATIGRTSADGILEGRWQEGSLLRMRYIEQGPMPDGQPRVRPGDDVVTSGLGGTIPSGLLLGRVERVQQSDTDLEQQAEVLPAVDVRSVDTVLVVAKR